jgi:hypothetical protein
MKVLTPQEKHAIKEGLIGTDEYSMAVVKLKVVQMCLENREYVDAVNALIPAADHAARKARMANPTMSIDQAFHIEMRRLTRREGLRR